LFYRDKAWDSKYAYNRLRPTAFDPSLTATLPNPQSPSYPSEHATVAGAVSTVLAYLFPDKADDFPKTFFHFIRYLWCSWQVL
jgi:membrane-associated phospholipid phosphatase